MTWSKKIKKSLENNPYSTSQAKNFLETLFERMLKNKIGWKKANLYNQQYIMKRVIEATSIHTKENLLLNDLSNSQSYNII